jgi:hypothetical protein
VRNLSKLKKEYDSQHKKHSHLQFAQANTQPKIAKKYALPPLSKKANKI